MKTWFIHHNNQSLGPYTIEELKNLSIAKDDYVWKQGLTNWVQAKSLPELNELFTATPPAFTSQKTLAYNSADEPVPAHYSYTPSQKKNGYNRLWWIAILLILSTITYLVYAKTHSAYVPPINTFQKSPAQLRAELAQAEKQNPTRYISGRTGHRKNLIGQTVIEGTLTSSATLAAFKDVVLQVDFLSKTNTIITTQKFTVYEIISPGKTISFKKKALVDKDVQHISVTITDATPVN